MLSLNWSTSEETCKKNTYNYRSIESGAVVQTCVIRDVVFMTSSNI